MKQKSQCKKCKRNWRVLGKNDMCFFCDEKGWYAKFGDKKKK